LTELEFIQELETLKAECAQGLALAIRSQQNHLITLDVFESALARITKLVDFVNNAEGSVDPFPDPTSLPEQTSDADVAPEGDPVPPSPSE